MATDYIARKKAKKSRHKEGLEKPKRIRKKKNQPRRLCRGLCYQEPGTPAVDSDGENDAHVPPRHPVGELSRYANLTFGDAPKRKKSSETAAVATDANMEKKEKKRPRAQEVEKEPAVEAPSEEDGEEEAAIEKPVVKRIKMSTAVNLLDHDKAAVAAADTLQPPSPTKRSSKADAAAAATLGALPEEIQKYMEAEGHTSATPVQAKCWPPLLAGHDATVVAPPGSGKTLGYILPAASKLIREGHSGATRPPGPLVLVLLPTRELAQQVAGVCRGLKRQCSGLRSVCLTGGSPKEQQVAALNRGPHIVVATPGRLVDLEEEGHVVLGDVSYIVLDEADKMLGTGFTSQIEKLKALLLDSRSEDTRPQITLFSATMPTGVRTITDTWLDRPKRIALAGASQPTANEDSTGGAVSLTVTQTVQVCAEHKKPAKLLKHLEAIKQASVGLRHAPRVLIFSNRIKTVRFLAKTVERAGFKAAQLHGQRSQDEREEAVKEFRAGKVQVLVASDVAARGLDIRNLPYVVNYDFPSSLETYVHRVGRTGRLAADGHAFSFFTREMAPVASSLLDLLKEHGQSIDPNLIKLSEAYSVAAKKLGLDNAASAAAPSCAPLGGTNTEEEGEDGGGDGAGLSEYESSEYEKRKQERPATEDVLHELSMKSKADKKRDKLADAKKRKKSVSKSEKGTTETGAPATETAAMKEFLPARKFTGAKSGYVFKQGGMGLGYYIDRPPFLAAKARDAQRAAAAKTKPGALVKKPIGGAAGDVVKKKAVPLLPGRLKQLRRGRESSPGDSGDEDMEPIVEKKKSKPLPGRLRKKLAKDRASGK